ncbi:hypothetical protein GCM10022399_37420 [Terrabacter ginsenosidimutans]|uniref:Macro domain-containing protein n=1 Tax=Terrabacter ginsenosidimutans TaxID=490575 RepID=A0ABP7ECM1_9MICO
MTYREMSGNLFTAGLPAIGHGCNTAGSMSGGIARQVRDRWPDLYAEYAQLCRTGQFRLGSFQVVDVGDILVYNLATQRNPGPDASLEAIRSAVAAALYDVAQRGIGELGVPRLGAGIGGLEWRAVEAVLRDCARASPVDLIVVALPRPSHNVLMHERGRPRRFTFVLPRRHAGGGE